MQVGLGKSEKSDCKMKTTLCDAESRDKLNIGWHNWFVLTNAYTHGGYSTQAISKTIEFSGKTVHPTIPRSAWQQTIEYQIYINK